MNGMRRDELNRRFAVGWFAMGLPRRGIPPMGSGPMEALG